MNPRTRQTERRILQIMANKPYQPREYLVLAMDDTVRGLVPYDWDWNGVDGWTTRQGDFVRLVTRDHGKALDLLAGGCHRIFAFVGACHCESLGLALNYARIMKIDIEQPWSR